MKSSIMIFCLFWLIWTLVEYLFHRFILHRSILTKYIHDDKHHANVKFKPSEIPFFLTSLVLLVSGFYYSSAAVGGFGFGMLIYVAFHHLSHKKTNIRYLREHHKYHHLVSAKHNFGITTNFWDYCFGTCKTGSFQYSEKKEKIYYE